MTVSNGTIIRVVASLLFPDSVIAQNVFHLVATDLSGGNDADDVVQDMEQYIDDIFTNVLAFMSNLATGGEIKVYEYDAVDDDFDEIGTGAMGVTFTGATDFLPHGVALVQNFYTLDPDVQGRKFWGGQTVNNNIDGTWGSTTLAAFVNAAADVITTFTSTVLSNEYQPVVWSPTGTVAQAYSGTVATNATPGYQRRRKPGVGI